MELGARRSVTDASQPRRRSKVPAAQKQLPFGKPWCRKPGWRRGCQGYVGKRAQRHGGLTGMEKLEVRPRSGFPEGETSPEAMNAAGSGAMFCKHLGILRNLKKTSRRQELSEDEGICEAPDLGSALGWMVRVTSNAVLGSSPDTLQEQRRPARSRGEVWAVPTFPLRCVETPHRWRIGAWDSGWSHQGGIRCTG